MTNKKSIQELIDEISKDSDSEGQSSASTYPWPSYKDYKGEVHREVTPFHILCLLVFPFFSLWFLFREGYTWAARVAWVLYAIIASLILWPSIGSLLTLTYMGYKLF